MRSREQKLIDLMYEMILTITSKPHVDIFKKKSNDKKAEWITETLKGCGFNVSPCGSTWGLLEKEESIPAYLKNHDE